MLGEVGHERPISYILEDEFVTSLHITDDRQLNVPPT